MRSALLRLLLLAALIGGIAPAKATAQQPRPSPAQEGFVPFESVPPKEELPAARFLIAAYAVAWIVIFTYLWSIWRRLARVEQEIAVVARRLGDGPRR
jgi:CcmD family protein